MAAPNTAYLNSGNAIRLDEEDLTGSILNSYDALIAAYIYGSANIKTLFYLDAIVEVEITDDAGTVIATGFIGLVKTNGVNYNYHAAARRFKGALPVYTDFDTLIDDYVALNDGGLNTLGNASGLNPATDQSLLEITTGNINFLSSYYDSTTKFGIRWRVGLGSWNEIASSTTLLSNQSATEAFPISGVSANQSLEVYAFILNPEGETQTATSTILVLAQEIDMLFSTDLPCGGSINTYYLEQPLAIGATIYNEPTLNFADAGYYTFGTSSYRQEVVGGNLEITAIDSCVGIPSKISFAYRRYESTSHLDACFFPGIEDEKFMFYQLVGGVRRFYTTTDGNTLMADGWYSYEVGVDTYETIQLINGFDNGVTAC